MKNHILSVLKKFALPGFVYCTGLVVSLSSLHKSVGAPYEPNFFVAFLCCWGILLTQATRSRVVRLIGCSCAILLIVVKLISFFGDIPVQQIFLTRSSFWLLDHFTILQVNVTMGALAFYLLLILHEVLNIKEPRIWIGLYSLMTFIFVTVGCASLFFHADGFRIFSLARVDPFHALMIQMSTSIFIFQTWPYLYSQWKTFKVSWWIVVFGAVAMSIALSVVEKQIVESIQNQMESKVSSVQLRLKNESEERLSSISVLADFLGSTDQIPHHRLKETISKLNPSTKLIPNLYFYTRDMQLLWAYHDKRFMEARQAKVELKERIKLQVKKINYGPRNDFEVIKNAESLSLYAIVPVFRREAAIGYLVIEDPVIPTMQFIFSRYYLDPFNTYVTTDDGQEILEPKPRLMAPVRYLKKIDFFGANLQILLTPNRQLLMQSVLLPQLGLLAMTAIIVFFLVYVFYQNRKRVLDIEQEVQDRVRDLAILKEEADRAKLAAENASYIKSQFLANMSHEIRTPLNVLLGASELLENTSLDTDQRKFVELFSTSGKHLLSLLNDIIDLSRIEAGQLEIEKIPFDLRRTLDFIRRLFAIRAREVGIKFIVEDDALKNWNRIGDPLRIRQILVNLLGNAFKFTIRGYVKIKVTEKDNHVVFEVEDTGTGIAEDKVNEIFLNFTQGDISMTRRHGGAGLGLAITKNLCEMMGGSIRLESNLGIGTKFFVSIPLESCASSLIQDTLSEDSDSSYRSELLGPKKILVVDDSDDNRFLVKLFLDNPNFSVSEAENGQVAVELVKSTDFDLILMDMQMPIMDGYEAVKSIRNYESMTGHAPTPILALTAHGVVTEKEKCLSVGCNDYIAKPVSRSTLLSRIHRWMNGP
ncbi:MAG: response regulator, partial [Bdellovibrio sp.]